MDTFTRTTRTTACPTCSQWLPHPGGYCPDVECLNGRVPVKDKVGDTVWYSGKEWTIVRPELPLAEGKYALASADRSGYIVVSGFDIWGWTS